MEKPYKAFFHLTVCSARIRRSAAPRAESLGSAVKFTAEVIRPAARRFSAADGYFAFRSQKTPSS